MAGYPITIYFHCIRERERKRERDGGMSGLPLI